MKTLTIASQKGGAGKTTLAVNLAVAAYAAGYVTAVIDLDPQANASKWGDRRKEAGRDEPEVISDHAERLAILKREAEEGGADLLIIDTPPFADRTSLLAAKASDFILIPCRPNKFDLEAIGATRDVAALAKKPSAVVINAAPPKRNSFHAPSVLEAIAGLEGEGAVVAPHVIGDRVDFSHPVNDGRAALEYEPGGKAAAEIRSLFLWTCQQVGLPARQPASVEA